MDGDATTRAGTAADGGSRATLTVEEAGRLVGIGRGAAYAAVKRGELPSIRFGRKIVVPRPALEALLEGRS